MTNHVHLIASASGKFSLSEIMRDMKKFTSKKLTDALEEEDESHKEWMLDKFEFKGRYNTKIKIISSGRKVFIP